jgi:hypothetical protein
MLRYLYLATPYLLTLSIFHHHQVSSPKVHREADSIDIALLELLSRRLVTQL